MVLPASEGEASPSGGFGWRMAAGVELRRWLRLGAKAAAAPRAAIVKRLEDKERRKLRRKERTRERL